MKVTLRQLLEGGQMSLKDTLVMEYRISQACMVCRVKLLLISGQSNLHKRLKIFCFRTIALCFYNLKALSKDR